MIGIDKKDFEDALFMTALTDGDSYRANNPEDAVLKAFVDYKKRRDEEEQWAWRECRKEITADLAKRWREQKGS